MNIIILGAAGFIGTNLTNVLVLNSEDKVTLVDVNKSYFAKEIIDNKTNISIVESSFDTDTDFEKLLCGQDIVYHLVSTTVPVTSNKQIANEITANVVMTANLLDACVKCNVKKVIFISSGGTVYGKESECPLKEDMPTNPISSYGVQKLTIEKLLFLYNYMYGIDYRIIRLANPYGPYQRPNGILGAVTTFTYKALNNEKIEVYGRGDVIRDFIYIEDAVSAILNISNNETPYKIYNVGSGYGTSINELLTIIRDALSVELNIEYKQGRNVDVPINYLDISRYESSFGKLEKISLEEGIVKTAEFIKSTY